MNSLFDMNSKFFQLLAKTANLVLLNLLWLLCCLPVITAGAATSAMFYVTLKMVRDEEAYIIKSFFHSFRQNLKQGTLLWLLLLAVGLLFGLDYQILNSLDTTFAAVLKYALYAVTLLYLFVLAYIFPLLAKFDNSIKNLLKNALMISISYLPKTLIILLIQAAPLFLLLWNRSFFYLLPVWVFIGFSGTAYLCSHLFVRIFDKYIS